MSQPGPRPVELLRHLVGFDTTSWKSNLGLIAFVQDYLAGHGIASHLIHNAERNKANLFATIGPPGDGGIVLSGHTDVVPVEGQDWASDPFALDERDGRLYGRGSADMKGFIATALSLVPEMVARPLKVPLHFAFSYDEELGCIGVPGLLAEIARSLPRPRIAIIGEPTTMRLVNAHKGIFSFYTTVVGREAHSSATHRAVSAILHAADIIGFIDELAEEMREQGPHHADFDPPWTTFNVGRIQGGTAVNIVPRHCRFDWEFRPVPGADAEALAARVQAFIDDKVLPRMRAVDPEATVVTERRSKSPPLMPDAESPAEALVRLLTGQNDRRTVAFATEAGLFQQSGISAVVIGPGDIAQAHKPDEFVARDQIDACEAFLRKLVDWARTG